MPHISITVNGKVRKANVEPRLLLVHFLREHLLLTGTHVGCDTSQCGACTVQIRGRAVRSCQTPVSAAAGAPITTIEGLSVDGTHPLQVVWQEIDVPQCGYCQAGQIMSAAALLSTTPRPTNEDIDRAMNGNLCRCGTYLRIREAIHKAAALMATRPAQTARAAAEPVAGALRGSER